MEITTKEAKTEELQVVQNEQPPPLVDLTPVIKYDGGKELSTFGIHQTFVGPDHTLELLAIIHPVDEFNNWGKDVGFVVSKNALILKLQRAVQGNNMCMRITIRSPSRFRICFFSKELKKLGEFVIQVGILTQHLDMNAAVNKLDELVNLVPVDHTSLAFEPITLQGVFDMENIITRNVNLEPKDDFFNLWRNELKNISSIKILWNRLKAKFDTKKK